MSYQNLEAHTQRKEQVLTLLSHAEDVLAKMSRKEDADALRQMSKDVEHGRFSIVVVGQFSAGKSTFLNALMGEKYLPSFQTETTATINFLKSIDDNEGKSQLVVKYKDGHEVVSEDVSKDNIEKYVSVKGDNVATTIEYVTLYLDSKFLKGGVTLVDCPGLGGVLENHAEITRNQIMKSHAAIFMFNANQPGSASDFKALKSLKSQCQSTLIVLNQIDNIKESEQSVDDVINNLKENYGKQFPNDPLPEIWPIASYPALVSRSKQNLDYHDRKDFTAKEKEEFLKKSRFEQFEDRLIRYLTNGEKTRQELLSPVEKVKSYLTEAQEENDAQIKDLEENADGKKFADEITSLQSEIDGLEKNLKNKESGLTSKIKDLIRNTTNDIKARSLEIRNDYINKLDKVSTSDAELEDLQHDYKAYIAQMNMQFNQEFSSALENAIENYKDIVIGEFADIAKDIEDRLNGASVEGNLNINFKIDDSYFDQDIDLSKYNERMEALRDEISDIEAESDNNESMIAQAEENQFKADKLEKKIADANSQKFGEIQSLGPRPQIERYTKTRRERHWGLGGILKWIWNGNPGTEVRYEEEDDSAVRQYESDKAEIQERYNSEIEQAKSKLKALGDTNSRKYQVLKQQLDRKMERKREALAELEKEQDAYIEKDKRRAIRKAQNYIDDCAQEIFDKTRKQIIEKLHAQQDSMTKEALHIIQDTLARDINSKKSVLEKRKEILEKGGEEKAAQLEKDKQFRESIAEVLREQFDCEVMLNNIEVDTIETNL
ncbi:dynamin family protein [uncultured Prevotella sp.]|uniref:dynamin family protein n=1 Tax=uncultured Prevotella sp. TaxID=159272 RepID=UPI0025922FA2|nr:dynamin family protein [uncultured Prevotella sp.]